jgi:outer membrane protein assembly factor BamB
LLLAATCLLGAVAWAQVVVHEIPAPSADATGLCWDGSALWVSDDSANVYKVNPSTGAVMRTLTGPVAGSRGLAYASGYLWTISRVASDLHVYKIDTTTGAVVTQIADPTNGYAGGLAWDGSALWFSVRYPVPRVLRVDPADGDTLAMFNTTAVRPYGVGYDGSSIWISSEDTGVERVYRLNQTTGETLWSFPLPVHTPQPGRRPRGVAWDGQFLWVIAYETNTYNVKIFKYDVSNAVNPDIHTVETSHDYGSRVVGYPLNWSVDVINVGNSNLVISSASFVSGAAYNLMAPLTFPVTINPAATTVFTVRFNPPAAGDFRDTLRIFSNDPDENPYLVALRGTGLPDEGDVDPQPSELEFGPVRITNPLLSNSRTLELHNAGTGTLHVTGLEIVGDTAFTMDAVNLPVAVDSFAYINVRVWFAPRRTITYNASLRVHSDDPDEPVLNVPLSGTGDGSAATAGDVLWYFQASGGTLDHDINSVQWIGDVNHDGVADALAASGNYLVYCLNGSSTGLADTLWTFNSRTDPNYAGYVYYERGMCSSPDITGDDVADVLIGTSGNSRSVYALSGVDGALMWTFDTHFFGGAGGSVNEVASVGDLDGDLVPDVLGAAGDDAGRVFALSGASGQLIWPGTHVATFYTVRPIHDVTGDNIPDVVGGTISGIVAAYNGATGVSIWTVTVASGSPIFSLLPMGNANPEVTISEDVVVASAYTGVYCLDGNNGARIWTRPEQANVYRLAVGSDITGDNVNEVYYGTVSGGTGGGWVRCLDGSSGQIIWQVVADPFSTANVWGLVAVPDVTGDAIRDIACGTQGGNVVLLDGWDGTRIWATPGNGPSSPVDAISGIPDVDHSGSWDVLAGHRSGVVEVIAGSDGIYIPPERAESLPSLISQFALGAAYPNPFNATTTISYTLPRESEVRLEIFDLLGRHVITLMDAVQAAGVHAAVWAGESASGTAAGSGVYFVRLQCESFRQTHKLVLMK